jgi:phage-related protein (TIGR01555 family)
MWPFKKQLIVADDTKALTRSFNPMAADNLVNFVTGMGTSRDQTRYSRYLPETGIDRMTADSIFRGSWLGKRVITTIADDMVREWRKVMWDDSQDDDGVFAVTREEDRLQVAKRVHTALKWGRQFGGAIMVMITKDATSRAALAEPLDVERVKQGDLLNLVNYDRWRIYGTPPEHRDYNNTDLLVPYLNQSLDDPNYGLPEFYHLADTSVKVHNSRCIRFDGEELSWYEWSRNAMWHDSVYKSIIKALTSYDTLMAGCSTMVTQANLDILSAGGLTDALSTDVGTTNLLKRYELLNMMKSVFGIVVLDKESETLDRKPLSALAGVTDLCNRFALDVAGAADVPISRLFGQSASGMNATGEGDLVNHENHIHARQKSSLSPQMAKLDQVLVRSALGYMPDDYRSEWNPLRQQNDADKATNEQKRAARDAIYIDRKVVTRKAVATELRAAGIMPNLTQEDVDAAGEADEKATTAPPPPVIPGNVAAVGEFGKPVAGEEDAITEQGVEVKPNGMNGKKPKPGALAQ